MSKLAVYTIMKDESYNVDGFVKSLWDNGNCCDYVCVLDTGSSDNSEELLKQGLKAIGFKDNQVIVKSKKYKKFRFDVARNDSLDLVPEDADICISIDLDERFCEGYVDIIKKAMTFEPNIGLLSYKYAWEVDRQTNQPIREFDYCKCHLRNGIKWMYPIHEHLDYNKEYMSKYKTAKYYDKTLVYHYPNLDKSRIDYLGLLIERYNDDNTDLNACYYIGREHGFRKEWSEAITWYDRAYLLYKTNENCRAQDPNAIKFIHWNMAQAYRNLGLIEDAEKILVESTKKYPSQTTMMFLAEIYLDEGKLDNALDITELCKMYGFKKEVDQDFRLDTTFYRDWLYNFIKAVFFQRKGFVDTAYAFYAKAFQDIKTEQDENSAYLNGFYSNYANLYNLIKQNYPNSNIVAIPDRFLKK